MIKIALFSPALVLPFLTLICSAESWAQKDVSGQFPFQSEGIIARKGNSEGCNEIALQCLKKTEDQDECDLYQFTTRQYKKLKVEDEEKTEVVHVYQFKPEEFADKVTCLLNQYKVDYFAFKHSINLYAQDHPKWGHDHRLSWIPPLTIIPFLVHFVDFFVRTPVSQLQLVAHTNRTHTQVSLIEDLMNGSQSKEVNHLRFNRVIKLIQKLDAQKVDEEHLHYTRAIGKELEIADFKVTHADRIREQAQ